MTVTGPGTVTVTGPGTATRTGTGTATVHRGVRLMHGCERGRLPAALRDRFVDLPPDAGTRAFIDRALDRPQPVATTALRDLAAKLVSLYDANALLGAFSMRVLGTEQWRRILGDRAGGRLLDVGAGDGEVTAEAAPLFEDVTCTELSAPMARRLRARGFRCHEVDLATEGLPGEGAFDVLALLNVLDRTARPLSLLERAPALLAPGGRLVLAVPVPISPTVFVGPVQVDPEELLPAGEVGFEPSVAALHRWVLEPMGLEVELLARVPYLCRGDRRAPVQVLDDALFVCRPTP